MKSVFEEALFSEFDFPKTNGNGHLIKKSNTEFVGKTKVSVEEENHEGVKIILKKDSNDSIKEIKFVCSCGQTKSIILDYSE